jgi:hypothetical protein
MVAVGPVALDVGRGRTKEKADEIVRLFHEKSASCLPSDPGHMRVQPGRPCPATLG